MEVMQKKVRRRLNVKKTGPTCSSFGRFGLLQLDVVSDIIVLIRVCSLALALAGIGAWHVPA